MCGIAAVVGTQPTREQAEAVLKALAHRGPDGSGELAFPAAWLGHTRLSIIDIAGGAQPMRDATHHTAIVFNGEIYNYKELREELHKKGHTFTTHSDTEVILKAYAEWGHEAPTHLDGMFAFAIWDEGRQELFLARDRFGKKPLYYAQTSNDLVIASEVKALVALGVTPKLDPVGIDAYLALMYSPPWRTIYSNVETLPPAHSALYKNGAIKTSCYWQLPVEPISISYDEAKEEARRLFDESVRKRLVADVEVGSLLSGGVDSTLVTAYAQKHATHPLKTFSLGYGEHINELPFAETASKTIGTEHHTLQASGELTDELEKTLRYFDEPHGDSADFPQHLVSELAARKVKVALAGDGGDELFLGYGHYFAYWHTRKITRLKNALFSNPYAEFLRHSIAFPTTLRRAFLREPTASESFDHLIAETSVTGIARMNLFDLHMYLPGQLLTKVDRMSMMHGLEIRCPFLDYTLAEFVFNLPEAYKTDRSTGKLLLKDLLAEVMPREFVDRKKQGFGAPVRKWLGSEHLQHYVQEKFGTDARVYAFLKKDTVEAFVRHTLATLKPKASYQLWVLLCLEVWLRQHDHEYTT